jgi:hypothetical protein
LRPRIGNDNPALAPAISDRHAGNLLLNLSKDKAVPSSWFDKLTMKMSFETVMHLSPDRPQPSGSPPRAT